MAAIGGPIESVSVDGREFEAAADSDGSRDLGGSSSEQQPNGGGGARIILTRKTWKSGTLNIAIDDDAGDQEFLQANASALRNVPIVIVYASGARYNGSGKVTGDLMFSNTSATCGVEFSGPRTLVKQ